jgi:hypothetical protein
MSTAEGLSSGASETKVRLAPGLWIYILERWLEYQVEGRPPRTCNAGAALIVPAGAVHAVRDVCSGRRGRSGPVCRGNGEAGRRAGRVSASGAADCRSGFPARQKGHRS